MPTPTASEIEAMASGALQSAGLQGEDAPKLAKALGGATAQALTLFSSQAMVAPGIAAAAPPPALSGSTLAPGMLLPPPAGGPDASALEPICQGMIAAEGLQGEDAPGLGKAIGKSLAQAIMLFTAQVMVAPGLAIAGGATASPGMLQGPAPAKGALEPIVSGMLQAEGVRGENAGDLAGAIAETIANALTQCVARLMVAPGIPCTPAATAGPGRLM